MIILGVDAHKRTHTFVVVDEGGRKLAERTVSATEEGHVEALAWARRWDDRRFAVEDCRPVTRRLEADLLAAGETVVRVPTKLMAGARRSGRTPGKSDPIDALAVARAAIREPDLPIAHLDGATRELRLLVDHREDLVAERTRIQSRLRWHVHELFPGLEIAPASLGRHRHIAALEARLVDATGTVAEIARELLKRCRELTLRAKRARKPNWAIDPSAGTDAAGSAGLRRALRRQDRGRSGRGSALPLEGGVRPLERNSTDPRLVR